MEFKSDEGRVVLRREDRDEFGNVVFVEHYITLEGGSRLYNELNEALYQCRQFVVESKINERKALLSAIEEKQPVSWQRLGHNWRREEILDGLIRDGLVMVVSRGLLGDNYGLTDAGVFTLNNDYAEE